MVRPLCLLISLVVLPVLVSAGSYAQEPLTLTSVLGKLDVSHHWLAGKHVDWLTGNPDGQPVSKFGHHTHCSAFVAAVCKQLDVPMLAPPQHPQELLADAQFDWLISASGKAAGWLSVTDSVDADRQAHSGKLVIAVYHSPDERLPGHIAIVLPSDRSAAELERDGPDITQAGLTNYSRATLRVGFKHHPAAWETDKQVRFFSHAIPKAEATDVSPSS